jgi:hypothetical protein
MEEKNFKFFKRLPIEIIRIMKMMIFLDRVKGNFIISSASTR